MGEPPARTGPIRRRRRVFVEDSRRNGTYLRTTWHREERTFVVSIWNDQLCTGAVRVPVEQSAELVGLLVDGLGEAAGPAGTTALATTAATGRGEPPGPIAGLKSQLGAWARWAADRAGRLLVREDKGSIQAGTGSVEPIKPPDPQRRSA